MDRENLLKTITKTGHNVGFGACRRHRDLQALSELLLALRIVFNVNEAVTPTYQRPTTSDIDFPLYVLVINLVLV